MRIKASLCSIVHRLLPVLAGAAVFFCSFELKAADIYDNGPPDHANGLDMGDSVEADDFPATEAIRFDGVKFWDFEAAGAFAGVVTWQIYANDDSNIPGRLIAGGVSMNLLHVDTGRISFSFHEYVNDFSVTPLYLRPGTYWLGLHNGTLDQVSPLTVFWENTSGTGIRSSYYRTPPYLGPWISNSYPGFPQFASEFAFRIQGVPAPTITSCVMANGLPRIRFKTAEGETYRVVYKDDLRTASWLILDGAESISGTGTVVEATDLDPRAKDLPRRFYRVEML
ncbi:MAG: hypothetical protein M3032_07260 [Verrucomicrobiota bacterium]|nr:hypothetical protein [Verrucomicrobiota bacterium]